LAKWILGGAYTNILDKIFSQYNMVYRITEDFVTLYPMIKQINDLNLGGPQEHKFTAADLERIHSGLGCFQESMVDLIVQRTGRYGAANQCVGYVRNIYIVETYKSLQGKSLRFEIFWKIFEN